MAGAWRMGDDLEPMVLFDDAQPGEKVVVAVKLLHTVDAKTFRGATLKIDFAENRPNPEDLRKEFLVGGGAVPSLAPGDAAQDGDARTGRSTRWICKRCAATRHGPGQTIRREPEGRAGQA